MKSRQENTKVFEEQTIAIIDHSANKTPQTTYMYTKLLRGWFDRHDDLKYQNKIERQRAHLHFEVRKT